MACTEPMCVVSTFGSANAFELNGVAGQCRSLESLLPDHPQSSSSRAILSDATCHERFGPGGSGLVWQAARLLPLVTELTHSHEWDEYDLVHLQGDCLSTDALAAGCTFVPCTAPPLACEEHTASDCPLDRCAVSGGSCLGLCPAGPEAYPLQDGTMGVCLCDPSADGLCTGYDGGSTIPLTMADAFGWTGASHFCRHQHGPNDELRWLRSGGDDTLEDDHPVHGLSTSSDMITDFPQPGVQH